MKILRVSPGRHPVQIDSDLSLESMQKEVGGYIQVIYPFDDPVAIVCDDDGKMVGKHPNRALRNEEGDIYDFIVGDFLVVGICEDDFMELTPELLEKYRKRFDSPEYVMRFDDMVLWFNEDGRREIIG